jgi:hypothetical protein
MYAMMERMGYEAWKDYWLLDAENGGWFNVQAPGTSFRAKIQRRSHAWQDNPKPVVLPYGLWERAEARHSGETPLVGPELVRDFNQYIQKAKTDREMQKLWWSRHYGRAAGSLE